MVSSNESVRYVNKSTTCHRLLIELIAEIDRCKSVSQRTCAFIEYPCVCVCVCMCVRRRDANDERKKQTIIRCARIRLLTSLHVRRHVEYDGRHVRCRSLERILVHRQTQRLLLMPVEFIVRHDNCAISERTMLHCQTHDRRTT
jgi:hypothetical protein